MRQTRAHVGFEQSSIEAKRSIELDEPGVSLTLKSASPQILLCVLFHSMLIVLSAGA
jgi:hypothetical protein